ncbi:MAG TPA: hypothetical protein VE987_22600 [Polyangiaceae bacterium]|nr:hypothetical protein [Polyangiaceae bacterium]
MQPSAALGDEPEGPLPVVFSADQVRVDPRARALEASGDVRVDEPPFHLTSDALVLRRVPLGVELDGQGRLAFCRCLGTPLAVRFHDATIAPPHDVVLRQPVLEVFGLPLAWAPVVWLRSPGRLGLLPPDVAWRGADGLFLGGGLHAPWTPGDVSRGLDVRAGAYLDGGVALQVAMRTTVTESAVGWDRWRGDDGVRLQLRGASAIAEGGGPASTAWSVDALRGARAVKATTELEPAARPFDRAAAQTAVFADGWTVASGARAAAVRGSPPGELGAGGPVVAVRRAGTIARAGAYDATLEGGGVVSQGHATTSFARAEGGALLATRLGAAGASIALRGFGGVADAGSGADVDAAAQARAAITLPLARAYGSPDEADPWIHRTEPRIEAAVVAVRSTDVLVAPPARGSAQAGDRAWVADAGWYNALGRWGARAAAELDVACGAVGTDRSALPAARLRAAGAGEWFALGADLAALLDPNGGGATGAVWIARARVGAESSPFVSAHVAGRVAVDPLLARALSDAPLQPASGFLSSPGWTGGASAGVPIGPRVTARGGVDVDVDARQLVAALGALELHDPCNCVVVRATAAHRIGRGGVDAWVSIDLARR